MYESPRITAVGSLPELTLATGYGWNHDGVYLFTRDSKPTDPPVGS